MSDLDGKIALVTGGASGIGRASAQALAAAGATVVVLDLDANGAATTVDWIESAGGAAWWVQGDVALESDVAAAVGAIIERHGRLDLAHNNAGVNARSREAMVSAAEIEPNEWRRILRVNLKGVWLCLKHELRVMKPRWSGAVVNTASFVAKVGFAHNAAYVASKHGVIGLTTAAAGECRPLRIRVNSVSPGIVDSPSLLPLVPSPLLLQSAPGPESVAAVVCFLLSDAAFDVTGQDLVVGL